MIRVIKGTVKTYGEMFLPGEIIDSLSEKEEASLIAAKVAEPWGTVKEIYSEDETEKEDGTDNEDKQIQNTLSETGESEKPEAIDSEKEPSTEPETSSEDKSIAGNNEVPDKIEIKFDAAAYVDGPEDKPKTRRK